MILVLAQDKRETIAHNTATLARIHGPLWRSHAEHQVLPTLFALNRMITDRNMLGVEQPLHLRQWQAPITFVLRTSSVTPEM
jgi:hypothetical protein